MSEACSGKVATGLGAFCRRQGFAPVSNLRLLTGGANMELWAFDSGDLGLVLRRYRGGTAPERVEETLSMATEAQILERAHAAGVMSPGMIGILETGDGLGPGYVMNRVEGESLPITLFRDRKYATALHGLLTELASEAVKIHQIKVEDDWLDAKSPKRLLSAVESMFQQVGYTSPVIALALHWLRSNLPPDLKDPCLVHGDFRMGNLLVSEHGLSAVLDWELVHTGAPEEDLAWFSTPSWRFGKYEKTAGGIGTTEELVSAYEAAGGRKIDHKLLQWYRVYSSLDWGAKTIQMAHWWRRGDDRSLERILVGTRISEVEIDLLLMLEELESVDRATVLDFPTDANPNASGDVRATELIEAAVEYLAHDVVPASAGAAKFHARIAANSLSIAIRILDLEPKYARRQADRLHSINLSDAQLCEHLMAGTVDWTQDKILDHLRLSCLERLAMHQPKYAAIQVATDRWRSS